MRNNLKIFKDKVISEESQRIGTDVGEAIIDSFIQDGIAKEIPGLGIVFGMAKIGKAIKERFELKKFFKFFNELNDIPLDKRVSFVNKLNAESDEGQEFYERLMQVLSELDELEKVKMSINIFKLYVYEVIDKPLFFRLISIVEKMYIQDLIAFFQRQRHGRSTFDAPILSDEERSSFRNTAQNAFLNHGLASLSVELNGSEKQRNLEINQSFQVTKLGRQLSASLYYDENSLDRYRTTKINEHYRKH